MHWLQALDTGLFHFINQSLSNPFCDWLMPILSGNAWFIPLAVLLILCALCFGNARARLCVLMLILVVALGDPLVINTIKKSVQRPRPFVTLPDARVFGIVGNGYVPPDANGGSPNMASNKSSYNSMPSSHAANWFAMTMVAFLFYRRSLWFMLPMALAVSFSRIYNGVHYPSDVLAGAILGAGYAVAFAIVIEVAWQKFGKKWFPFWHAQMPSLVPNLKIGSCETESLPPSAIRDSRFTIDRQWLYLSYILIFVMLIVRWLYIASGMIGLSQDEAYQWVWSKHLALSFYSQPPGVAFIQFAGTTLFGDSEFGVRFFAPLFAAILSMMVLRFFAREINARAAFCLLLIVTAVPLLVVGTILMTVDSPLVFCWMWALIAGWRATQPDGKTRDWLVVGLAMGLAFLCKYSALYQIVCFGIYFALDPPARIHLRKPGPWLALLVFSICTLPVVIWNSQHDWIILHQVAGNAGLYGQWHPTLHYFRDFIFQEFGLLNPVFFVGAICAIFGFWKTRREHPLGLYFFCMSAPVLLGHLIYSFHSRILPNWIAPAVPSMLCLMVVYWDSRLREGSRIVKSLLAIGLAFGFSAVAIMHDSNLAGKIAGRELPGEKDPSRSVRVWKQAAELAETEREKLQQQGKSAFIICSHYGITGLYSFYIPQARRDVTTSEPLVYPVNSDAPANQFYFWPEYDYRTSRKGQNAIFVSEADLYRLEVDWPWKWLAHQPINRMTPPPTSLPPRITQEFESVTDLGERDIKIGDRVFHRLHLWACYNLK